MDNNPKKVSEITDDTRCWIPQGTVSSKLQKFYKKNPLVQSVLSRRRLTSIEMGRVAVVGVELQKYYKLGLSNQQILNKIGNQYNLEDLEELTELIWNMNSNTARLMLRTGKL